MRADNESLVDLDELVSVLQEHEGPPQARERAAGAAGRRVARRPRTLRLRWGLVGAAVALLAGSGLGFGIADSLTPTSEASTPFAGLGFLPVRGWTVVQTGTFGPAGVATAIAANVPLDPADGPGDLPTKTLESLPARGVVIYATFTTRGDPGEDFRFPARSLPLDVAEANPVPPEASPVVLEPSVAQYRLRTGVSAYNVDARIFYGSRAPSRALLDAAQRQLGRLVVSAEPVTIFARPTVASGPPNAGITLFGSVENGRAGEVVDLQAKDCGQQFFRGVAGTTTTEGGRYSVEYFPGISTTLRAVWRGEAGPAVTVPHRAMVYISRLPRRGQVFRVGVSGKWSFWRKRVLVQQRRQGSWTTIRSVVMTASGSGGAFTSFWGYATLSVPKGTQVRALLPRSGARPCYLAATSPTVRA